MAGVLAVVGTLPVGVHCRVSLTLATYTAAEAGERGQASGMQVHSQRDPGFLNKLNSPRAIFVCGWLSNCGSEAGVSYFTFLVMSLPETVSLTSVRSKVMS